MSEVVYLPQVECEVEQGFLDWMYSVGITDEKGNKHFLQVPKTFVRQEGDRLYFGVGIVRVDYKNRRVLIELPHESDGGRNRMWMPFSSFRKEAECHDSLGPGGPGGSGQQTDPDRARTA